MTHRLRIALLALLTAFPICLPAQPLNATPTLLLGPADWRFERLPIPPGFAPDIKLTGFEEARFAPGMFNTSASNYFTYVLAVTVDGTPSLGTAELKEFLEKYYRGLSIGVGRRKQLKPDEAQINAVVTPVKTAGDAPGKFDAVLPFFDTFNDGRKINLNLEITVHPKPGAKKTYIVLLISPLGKEAGIWKKLHEIGEQLVFKDQ